MNNNNIIFSNNLFQINFYFINSITFALKIYFIKNVFGDVNCKEVQDASVPSSSKNSNKGEIIGLNIHIRWFQYPV